MKVFEQYIKKFDMNKGNVKAMYFHSIKMMELCKEIASSLGKFTEEEIIVCGLIGLFHDIGMFSNKFKNCLTIEDNTDKSKESIEILFEKDKLLRSITDDKKYDDIIKIAIYCQNKNGLPKGFDSKVLYFCMVVKDAHVIENFRMVTNYPYMDMREDFSLLIMKSKFYLAQHSIEAKRNERYQNAEDECYGFINEYPDSKNRDIAEQFITVCKKYTGNQAQ